MEKESLVKIAQDAGFSNMHGLPGLTTWLIGSVMSDDFETLYFRNNGDIQTSPERSPRGGFPVTDSGTVEIFGIVDPYDHNTCALYRLPRKELFEANAKKASHPMASAVWIDKRHSLYKGEQAVQILRTYNPSD